MNWEKVVKSLDDDWDRSKRSADFAKNVTETERHLLRADIAFMLSDALRAGLAKDHDPKQFKHQQNPDGSPRGDF